MKSCDSKEYHFFSEECLVLDLRWEWIQICEETRQYLKCQIQVSLAVATHVMLIAGRRRPVPSLDFLPAGGMRFDAEGATRLDELFVEDLNNLFFVRAWTICRFWQLSFLKHVIGSKPTLTVRTSLFMCYYE
jgi:hypothetical protein